MPAGNEGEYEELQGRFKGLIKDLGINPKVITEEQDNALIQ